MKVLSTFLCICIVFLIHISLQCTDYTPIIKGERIDPVTVGRWRHVNCAGAIFVENVFGVDLGISKQYCENVNMWSYEAAKKLKENCSKNVTVKVWCLFVTTIVAIWKIISSIKKPTITENTILQKEIKLLDNLNYLRSILDAIGVGVISTDTNMKITYINTTAGNMCGFDPKLAVGKHVGDVIRVQNKNNDSTVCILQNLKGNSMASEGTVLELLRHDGRYLEVQQKKSPLHLKGERVGTVILLLDVTASRNVIRKLSYSASHDTLTGLPNRASFEKHLRNAVNNSEERNLQHVIAFVDLDGFKNINDGAGHAAGDELLKQIAQLMQSQLRHSDFVARLGGDEFGLILFNCKLLRAKILMSKLVLSINEYRFFWEGEERRVGASAGITNVDSREKSISALLAEADAACYAAKRQGKGQVCVFEGCSE